MIADTAKDAGLNYIVNAAERLVLCSGLPADYAGVAAVTLAAVAIDNTDFTNADGDVSGRKTTLAAQTCAGSASGTATHYAIVDDTGTELLAAHTMTNVAITNGENQDVQAVDVWEIQDAA